MTGSFVQIQAADGGRFSGYLALPEGGSGPGIVVIQEIFGVNANIRGIADHYAEEGYVALAPDMFWRVEPGVELGFDEASRARALELMGRFDLEQGVRDIRATADHLRRLPQCTGKVGVVGFCLGGRLAFLAAADAGVDVAIAYYGGGIDRFLDRAPRISCPLVMHFGAEDKISPPAMIEAVKAAFAGRPEVEVHAYPGADHAFARVGGAHYDKPSAMMAHSRSIAAFRRTLGPHYDLSALWEQHTFYEFGKRDVDATMATMVAEPYVNHIPTMTGGVGYRDLARFYANHFIPKTPADTRLVPISRTIGADRVVDEMLFCFTHDIEIDWMLPGVPPTGKYVEVPLVAIINFRGPKLYHEHIYWDQASVLVQIGLLDPRLYPVAGVEQAKKLVDETRPSNTLMTRWADSAPKAAE